MPRCLHSILFLLALMGPAAIFAELPDINQRGLIDGQRSKPTWKLETSRTKSETNSDGYVLNTYQIELNLPDYGEVLLSKYRQDKTDDSFVSGGDVALGWLQGAKDLLLVSWLDDSCINGSAGIQEQHYIILQATQGKLKELLRKNSVVQGHDLHVGGTLDHHFFKVLLKKNGVVDQHFISNQAFLPQQYPLPPLYHESTNLADEPVFEGNVNETIVQTYGLQARKLSSKKFELYYISEDHDWLEDVAKHYLGPLAQIDSLLAANPDLKSRFKEKTGTTVHALPPHTRVKIPVPEKWIETAYEEQPH